MFNVYPVELQYTRKVNYGLLEGIPYLCHKGFASVQEANAEIARLKALDMAEHGEYSNFQVLSK